MGGAGRGLGARAVRRASIAFRDCAFAGRLLAEVKAADCFLPDAFFASGALFRLAEAPELFFFGAAFFAVRLVVNFLAAACFGFLAGSTLFAAEAFFAFGAVVILPGRFGFLEVAFLAFVARILFDADKPLLVAFVTRLLISHLGVENEPLHI